MRINNIRVVTNASTPYTVRLIRMGGFSATKLEKYKEGCRFVINRRSYAEVKTFFEENGKTLGADEPGKIFSIGKRILGRVGLIFGFFVIAVLLYFYSMCVTNVQIAGAREPGIIADLIHEKMSLPRFKKDVDTEMLKMEICLLDEISDATVSINGNVLCVTVLNELPTVSVPEDVVVSKYDALVTKIVLYEGDCHVAVGQAVKKGETLIEKTDKKAKGDVYGRIWLNESRIISSEKLIVRRTGRKETYFCSLDSEHEYKGVFTEYETEKSEVWLPMAVPLKVKKIEYYEVEKIKVEVDLEKEKEETISEAFSQLERKAPKNAQNAKKWFLLKTVDKKVILDLYYEVEIKIS